MLEKCGKLFGVDGLDVNRPPVVSTTCSRLRMGTDQPHVLSSAAVTGFLQLKFRGKNNNAIDGYYF
jgi:hypothetical protein